MKKRIQYGFTLIELMITVAIIGILAAIAYPSYTAQVQKSRRADAQVALMEIAQREESYFLRNRSYGDITALGYSTSSADGHYTLSIGGVTASTFTATATVVSGKPQAQDKDCKTLSIDNRGAKSATKSDDTASSVCWK